ncbi:hypothetical protein AcV7_007796 [Taiwanofungus camphoratus]|nr:hypothetical protein AcV7_007796 [Antrodia cinnamomea]
MLDKFDKKPNPSEETELRLCWVRLASCKDNRLGRMIDEVHNSCSARCCYMTCMVTAPRPHPTSARSSQVYKIEASPCFTLLQLANSTHTRARRQVILTSPVTCLGW